MDNQSERSTSPFIEPTGPLFGDPPEPVATFDGQLAVVTGASGLLGAAVASELARRGARVCLLGRSMTELRATAAALPANARVASLRCDLASADDVVAATDFVARIGAPVDVLVHAAGLRSDATVATGSLESLDEHYLLNVRGPYLLTQRLLGSLASAAGQVVFFTSAGSSTVGGAHHSISTAALGALATEVRAEAAAHGVRVLSVDADVDHVPDATADEFLGELARSVADVLGAPQLDVTSLEVRATTHPRRSVRQ